MATIASCFPKDHITIGIRLPGKRCRTPVPRPSESRDWRKEASASSKSALRKSDMSPAG